MKENRGKIIEAIKEVMEKDEEILFAYLFGSVVHHHDVPEGDIDVGVYLRSSGMREFLRKEEILTATLVARLHNDRIDLRILNVSPFLLLYSVIKEGVPIFVRDEPERVEFETRVMNRFFELKPYLDEHRQMVVSWIRAR